MRLVEGSFDSMTSLSWELMSRFAGGCRVYWGRGMVVSDQLQESKYKEITAVGIPTVLILTGLFIDVAAGRWGAYLRTPIPGLYLPDALLVLGILASVRYWSLLTRLPRIILVAAGSSFIYLFARFLASVLGGQFSEAPYLVVRDLAPFAFLSLVPLIAISLRKVPFEWLLWILRVATLLHIVAAWLAHSNILTPTPSVLVEASATAIFEYRGDLLGVIVGIGIVSWGGWFNTARASRIVQFVFLIAMWNLTSRAALITALVALALELIREFRAAFPWKLILLTGAALAVSILMHVFPTGSSVATADSSVVTADSVDPALERFISPGSSSVGTSQARLETYGLILEALPEDQLWIWGAGPGTDILYEICTGFPDAPPMTRIETDGKISGLLPKCPVDDAMAASTLRDPHNWVLNLMIHHGLIGLLVFVFAVGTPIWIYRKRPQALLPIMSIVLYFVAALFGVILSAPFGLLPVTVMLGYIVAANRPHSHANQSDTVSTTEEIR